MRDDWSDWGDKAYHEGDCEAFQNMIQDFLDLGIEDLALEATEAYFEAIDFYEKLYDYTIYYETGSKHWRSNETGQYVADPYQTIAD